MPFNIFLSAQGLQNANDSLKFENDFHFIVGEHQYNCPKMLACFISPNITKLLSIDPTETNFVINHSDEINEFEDIIKIMNGNPVTVQDENMKTYILSIAVQLGNNEIIELIMNGYEEITINNVIQRIIFLSANNFNYSKEIEFVSSHLDDFSTESLKALSVDILDLIMNDQKLSVFSEDSLFEKIRSLGEKYYSLFSCIHVEYLGENNISQLLQYINLDNLTLQLWSSMCRRLKMQVEPQLNSLRHRNTFLFDCNYPFDGILSSLAEKCGGNNIHVENVVNITASSDPDKNCHFVSDSEWDSYWYSENEPNSWIKFDFKDKTILLTDYTLQSDGSNGNHILCWAVEGSMDGNTWEVIDNQETNELNGFYKVDSYSCTAKTPFRFLRIRQTGENSSFQDYMLLAGVEFFGQIYKN